MAEVLLECQSCRKSYASNMHVAVNHCETATRRRLQLVTRRGAILQAWQVGWVARIAHVDIDRDCECCTYVCMLLVCAGITCCMHVQPTKHQTWYLVHRDVRASTIKQRICINLNETLRYVTISTQTSLQGVAPAGGCTQLEPT